MRERFQLPQGEPSPDAPAGEHTMGNLVASVLARCQFDEKQWLHAAVQEWPELIGPALARHSRPGRWDQGVLTIYASHSAWLVELERIRRGVLLKKLQARFGAQRIRSIRTMLDPEPSGGG